MLEIIEMQPDDKIVVKLPRKATAVECEEIKKYSRTLLMEMGN